jgi:hypothetical protein
MGTKATAACPFNIPVGVQHGVKLGGYNDEKTEMSKDPGALNERPFVMVRPQGLAYVGIHKDEAACWQVALGWPSQEEINARKIEGFAVYPATLTWATKGKLNSQLMFTTQQVTNACVAAEIPDSKCESLLLKLETCRRSTWPWLQQDQQ